MLWYLIFSLTCTIIFLLMVMNTQESKNMEPMVTLVRLCRYIQFEIPDWEYDVAEDEQGRLSGEAAAKLLQKYRIISWLDVHLPQAMRVDVAYEYTSDLTQKGWMVETMVG